MMKLEESTLVPQCEHSIKNVADSLTDFSLQGDMFAYLVKEPNESHPKKDSLHESVPELSSGSD